MNAQLILYNQLNEQCIQSDIDTIFYIQTDGPIPTWTSAGVLNLNIYSKILSYAAGYEFIAEQSKKNLSATFVVGDSYEQEIVAFATSAWCTHIVLMQPAETYLHKYFVQLQKKLKKKDIVLEILPNSQFLIDHVTFDKQFSKPPIMETFYRWMRKKTGVLMNWSKPIWDKWNYDKENRKFDRTFEDVPHREAKSTVWLQKALDHYEEEIKKRGKEIKFHFPVTRKQSLALLQYFIDHHLDRFGELEDAMYTTSDFVYHSMLSVPINMWLLTPQEVIEAIEKADSALNNKEGFIRQVLWWREYMYHWFQYYQDSVYDKNFFAHTTDLPERFWWTDRSPLKMNCVDHVIKKVDRLAYSHHIERLMIIGNFTLLMWYDPHQVNKRFREQYADAYERVVTPNVLWMSQYADGWKLATKPYVASANYVNKMSNYCKTCVYNQKEKYGPDACPLNYLYRNFINNHQEVFKKWRQWFIVKQLEKLDIELIQQQVKQFKEGLKKEKS